MNILAFPISYLFWHYTKALKNIFGIFSNFFWATYNFFSIPTIFKTFFSPWRKLDVTHDKKSGFGDLVGTFIVNTLMRIVGMLTRLVLIIIYIFCTLVVLATEIVFLICWILLPAIVIWLICAGLLKII